MTYEHEKKRSYGVFTVRKYSKDGKTRSHWLRIGTGFQNSDGSFNLRLRALPLPDPQSGLAGLHMRLPRPKPDEQENGVPENDEAGFYAEIEPLNGIPAEDL